ncbi:dolichol kinase [Spodoptera frugiperda]|uniref:dolichol kinase n=1 Tax=Spodoptera frugiperda TaxID=7108 RepID=A0A9R0ENZ8_SPOFR|nr:dolichol kinase [Spodoptera frugiperda]
MDFRRKSIIKGLFKEFDTKVYRIVTSIDDQIAKNLKDGNIVTRPTSTNGLWSCVLLPTVLVLYSILCNVSELYILMAYLSIGLVAYSFLFIIFVSVSCLVFKDNIYGGCTASTLVSALLLYAVQGQDLMFSLGWSMVAVMSYSALLRISLTVYPKTFTIGEAMVVTQSIVLFCVASLCKYFYNVTAEDDAEMKLINSVIFTVLSSVGIIVAAICILDDSQKTMAVFVYIISVAATYALMVLHVKLGLDCLVRLAEYVLLDMDRIKLFIFWVGCAFVAVFVIMVRTHLNVKANTITRKSFHILGSLVFLSGILYNIRLMTLAAGVGLGLVILLEALRKSGIDPISSSLQAAFNVYSDEKDVGSFAMTPIYLYVGLACPLILVPEHPGYELELLSGVLSIGIGDTAASWFGSKFGMNKWGTGPKTYEGTVFNILSQVALMHTIQIFGLLSVNNAMIRVAVAAAVSGVVEAKIDQVDNLILPLVTLLAFQSTFILC